MFLALQEKFSTAATGVFGSGWQWLGVDDKGELVLSGTSNQVTGNCFCMGDNTKLEKG